MFLFCCFLGVRSVLFVFTKSSELLKFLTVSYTGNSGTLVYEAISETEYTSFAEVTIHEHFLTVNFLQKIVIVITRMKRTIDCIRLTPCLSPTSGKPLWRSL